ncbi:MAG: beta-N-acetylhexosaminidase, partial [Akkermansiaceae bacterium]|nr:beta-N-acetylhexosaminidase [Akkermansiaceae bacterium]
MDPEVRLRSLDASELLPTPLRVEMGEARWIPGFAKGFGIEIDPAFAAMRGELIGALKEQGYPVPAREGHVPMRVEWVKRAIEGAPARVADQAYQLVLSPGLVRIAAAGESGAFYAVQTLRQLLPAAGNEMREISVTDWPAFPFRGFMHDTGRNYQEPALIKKQIEMFSRYKLNVFHFHFTDNPGWRIESKRHPELQSEASFSRHHGKFYTQREFREIVAFARTRQVLVIPELDVPGHSAAFRRAYGIDRMNSPGVRERLIDLVDELCLLVPAAEMPYIHLGTDEVKPNERVPLEWLEACAATAHRHGRKVIGWNPGIRISGKGEMVQQLWTEGSRPWPNKPYFDSQSNYYLNHIDPFEMLPAMSYQQPCRWGEDEMKLGPIACVWHDDRARDGKDVMLMNHVVPGMLLFSDNAWRGRPADEPDWWCRLPQVDSPLFARAVELEKRLLAQRDRCFADEPFPYLRQTDLEWRFIGPFDHGGNPAAVFPPETEGIQPGYQLGGRSVTWWPDAVRGATHYPSHFWYRSHLKKGSGTIYAFTRVWSPVDQDVGAWIGFNAWSRSSGRRRGGPTPSSGEWNRSQAAVWVNGSTVAPPVWKQPGIGGTESEEIPLIDEDYFYRAPSKIHLRKGWNEVMVKAPHRDEWKWVFTFIPVQPTGRGFNVREVQGLRYDAGFEGAEAEEFARLLAQRDAPESEAADDGFGPPCSFGNATMGPLLRFSSTLGIWSAENGHASIIEPSAKQRLLKIEGGMDRRVQLDLPDVETIDALSLFLRRWTRN